MSLVERLFPQAELEALGNKWYEPPSKKRRLDQETGPQRGQCQEEDVPAARAAPRRLNSESALDAGRHRLFTTTHQHRRWSIKSYVSNAKQSISDSMASSTNTASNACITASAMTSITAPTTTSCLPSFIEPTILQNYLQHLHPKDRSRYSLSDVANSGPESRSHDDTFFLHSRQPNNQDNASSPGSLTNDTSSPAPSCDGCPSPSAGIYEQLHASPFSHLIDGLRFTEHERNMVNDLLFPRGPLEFGSDMSFDKKPDLDNEQTEALDDPDPTSEGFLHKPFSFSIPPSALLLDEHTKVHAVTNEDRDNDVHSSGLSPGAEEGEEPQEKKDEEPQEKKDEEPQEHKSPAGIVMYDYGGLSDDDEGELFDFEKASAPSLIST
ncbi:hypothetical protein KCU88_g3045, partial [Aureobasidium melanogenum]